MQPGGLLVDYGGTLVEEVAFDTRAGNEWLLSRASFRPSHVSLDEIVRRADRVSSEVSSRRDRFQVEVTWASLTRLIHDYFGIRFDDPLTELELGFWEASVTTRPMPGAREALDEFRRSGVPVAVVSNSGFGPAVIRHELAKHGLADPLAFVMVSAEYGVRKPNPLLFETAAARLGVTPSEVWFVGDRLDTDVAGAKASGMSAVWLRAADARDEWRHHADLVASSWQEIVSRLLSTP